MTYEKVVNQLFYRHFSHIFKDEPTKRCEDTRKLAPEEENGKERAERSGNEKF